MATHVPFVLPKKRWKTRNCIPNGPLIRDTWSREIPAVGQWFSIELDNDRVVVVTTHIVPPLNCCLLNAYPCVLTDQMQVCCWACAHTCEWDHRHVTWHANGSQNVRSQWHVSTHYGKMSAEPLRKKEWSMFGNRKCRYKGFARKTTRRCWIFKIVFVCCCWSRGRATCRTAFNLTSWQPSRRSLRS